ncbi:tyrosine-type recombinase/integrase [Phenylobacterium sp.]|uniref:tyrosine-type recombinase/integrase n=1 Tax=Phenylobacterium sp. TaxID=1871053 RepID=UPI002E315D01|nr:integrase arm-type DNA-binding domain-containing protein [Phenylobacterium sp.]HEX4710678.1 integrase arm-type DNA-binding domain-containing protein [Phenylobacterium sp.]
MAKRRANQLTSATVASLIKGPKAGRHGDGHGLYLVVEPNGAARWVFLFRWRPSRAVAGSGRLREMGLGSSQAVSLKRAREKAAAARALLADGIDPIAERQALESIPTFGEVADELSAKKTAESRSKASQARLKRLLQVYCAPLRPLRVDRVDTTAVLEALRPIWSVKSETAHKARGVIEEVLNAAKARGFRTGENPAAWRGHLDQLLPKRSHLARGHHAAMNKESLPAFCAQLRGRTAVAARALEFLILTACRSSEVLGATWPEFDLQRRIWTIPASRTKAGREHRVPLSWRAIEILDAVRVDGHAHVFVGQTGRPMSGAAFDKLRGRMKVVDVTTHGFRSTFRDWCGEDTSFARELAEAALGHTVGDQTERAYRRGDALERRRELMEVWANFCASRTARPTPALHPPAFKQAAYRFSAVAVGGGW